MNAVRDEPPTPTVGSTPPLHALTNIVGVEYVLLSQAWQLCCVSGSCIQCCMARTNYKLLMTVLCFETWFLQPSFCLSCAVVRKRGQRLSHKASVCIDFTSFVFFSFVFCFLLSLENKQIRKFFNRLENNFYLFLLYPILSTFMKKQLMNSGLNFYMNPVVQIGEETALKIVKLLAYKGTTPYAAGADRIQIMTTCCYA